MKKIYSLISVAILAIVFSFSGKALPPEFEAVVGLNFSTVNYESVGFRTGFHAGFRTIFQIPTVSPGFYVNTAALLSLKGYKTDSLSFNPYFLDIPIHAGYKYEVDDRFAMFIEAGPYVGIGLFGKSESVDIFSDEVGYKRLDIGIGARGGVEFDKRYSASLGGDFGFLKVIDGFNAKPRNITFSLAYKF